MINGAAAHELPDCLRSLFVSQGIKASFDCAHVEQGRLSRTIAEGSNKIAIKAVEALKRSMRERASHDISTPTWTGKSGRAGASLAVLKAAAKSEASSSKAGQRQRASLSKVPIGSTTVAGQAGFLQNSVAGQDGLSSHVAEAKRKFLAVRANAGPASAVPLSAGEQDVVEAILRAFLNPDLSGDRHLLSTGGVLEHVAPRIHFQQAHRLKYFLSELCIFSRTGDGAPGVWSLRQAFWPLTSGVGN